MSRAFGPPAEDSSTVPDPVGGLAHAHGDLNALVLVVSEGIRAADRALTHEAGDRLAAQLRQLHDALFRHFADEEEALFPFILVTVPARASVVERLSAAHDVICASVARLVYLAGEQDVAALMVVHGQFEAAYVEHSREERVLFEELGQMLDDAQRAELTRRLSGL